MADLLARSRPIEPDTHADPVNRRRHGPKDSCSPVNTVAAGNRAADITAYLVEIAGDFHLATGADHDVLAMAQLATALPDRAEVWPIGSLGASWT